MKSQKKYAKKLFVLWCISFGLLDILSNIYSFFSNQSGNAAATDILSGFQLLFMAITAVYLYPLLIIISHYAKLEESRKILVAVRFLILLVSIWLVVYIILVVQALMGRA